LARAALPVQNSQNSGAHKNNTSGYKGVSWNKGKKKWESAIRVNGTRKNLGRFNTKEEAAAAYQAAALELHGEFARFD
jgi:hypothetical protein